MNNENILNNHGFKKIDENEFQKENWIVRIDGINFEIFSDPEIDTRYYFGTTDNLEKYLNAINKNNKGL